MVTPEPVDAAMVREAVGEDISGAEVLVVSPATNQSRLAFWVSDPDEASQEAERAQTEKDERLEEEAVESAGGDGESVTG